uniref:Uncharacterized protein n=1 Tax=Caenorhabditis japonica TaxID=281687 RepID=A0A8R1IP05_CAEJA
MICVVKTSSFVKIRIIDGCVGLTGINRLTSLCCNGILEKKCPLAEKVCEKWSVGVSGESAGATSCSRSNCAGTILATAVEAAPDSVVIRNLLVRR